MFSLTLFLFGFAAANSLALSSDGNATIMQDSTTSLAEASSATLLSQGQKDIVKQFVEHYCDEECNDQFKRAIKAVIDAADVDVYVPDWIDDHDRHDYFADNFIAHTNRLLQEQWRDEYSQELLDTHFEPKDHAKVIEEMSKQLDPEVPSMPDTVQMPENEDVNSLPQDQKDIVKEFVDRYCDDECSDEFEQGIKAVVKAANIGLLEIIHKRESLGISYDTFDSFATDFRGYTNFLQNEPNDYSRKLLSKFFASNSHETVIEEMSNQLVVAEFFDYFNYDEEILQLNFTEVMTAARISQFDLNQILATKSLSTFPHADRAMVIEEMRKHLAKAEEDRMMTFIKNISIPVGVIFVVVVGYWCLKPKQADQKVSKQTKEEPQRDVAKPEDNQQTTYRDVLGGLAVFALFEAGFWVAVAIVDFCLPNQQWIISGAIINVILLFILPFSILILSCLTSKKWQQN